MKRRRLQTVYLFMRSASLLADAGEGLSDVLGFHFSARAGMRGSRPGGGEPQRVLRIRERYPAPDWSIADKWVARDLLAHGTDPAVVAAVLRYGSPGFPRHHADPTDYLRRTLRAALFSRAAHPHSLD